MLKFNEDLEVEFYYVVCFIATPVPSDRCVFSYFSHP